ncbi:uncharacterized protein [Leptinotarsa decemlineata]|uniref:uncharacterized protein n=1 Tax=Leptinotarsa decemlineata TaxID=7539 RepID=UPI003D307594
MKIIVLLISISVCLTSGSNEIGYYWLDYNGDKIPDNALRIDENDPNSPYVGQVYTKEYELLPATIRPTAPFATFTAYNKELSSDKNIKILCSQYKENFEWVRTSAQVYKSLPNLVVGGFEVGGYQYFGRIYRNGRSVLGKLAGALALPFRGREQYVYDNIEVLTYKAPLDVRISL